VAARPLLLGSNCNCQQVRWSAPVRMLELRRAGKVPTAAHRNALERIADEEVGRSLKDLPGNFAPPEGAVLVRSQNAPKSSAGSVFPAQVYPAHPHNFTPLRPVAPGFSAVDRAVREVALESRFDLLERATEPKFAGECPGTPRREFQDGIVAGIRVRPVQNPYVRLTAAQKYRLNNWPSRDWKGWIPQRAHVRGSRRKYRLPEDISPYKDELGEWHPPRVSGRYKADIEKQYYMHNLPWVWANNYYQGSVHYMDREPKGKTYWYKKEFRRAQVAEALKRADQMVDDYRKERREKKRLSWIESMVLEFAGEQTALPYIRQRRIPKM